MLRFDPAPRLQHGSNFWRPSRQSRQQSGLKWLRVSMLKLFVRRTCVFVVGAICWWQSKARVPIFKEWDSFCSVLSTEKFLKHNFLFACKERKWHYVPCGYFQMLESQGWCALLWSFDSELCLWITRNSTTGQVSDFFTFFWKLCSSLKYFVLYPDPSFSLRSFIHVTRWSAYFFCHPLTFLVVSLRLYAKYI